MMNNDCAKYVIHDDISFKAYGQFNANAFQKDLESIARSCADKLALIDYSIKIIDNEINNDLNSFIKTLHSPQFKEVEPPNIKSIIIFHNEKYQIGLQSLFTSIKSFLDIYTIIITKSISESQTMKG